MYNTALHHNPAFVTYCKGYSSKGEDKKREMRKRDLGFMISPLAVPLAIWQWPSFNQNKKKKEMAITEDNFQGESEWNIWSNVDLGRLTYIAYTQPYKDTICLSV